MIKTENGGITIEGSMVEVLADLGVAIKAVQNCLIDDVDIGEEEAYRRIDRLVEMSRMPKEELEKEYEERMRSLS